MITKQRIRRSILGLIVALRAAQDKDHAADRRRTSVSADVEVSARQSSQVQYTAIIQGLDRLIGVSVDKSERSNELTSRSRSGGRRRAWSLAWRWSWS